MNKTIALSYTTRNYTSRDIFEVSLNKRTSDGAPPYNSGTSSSVGVTFDLGGPQTLTWTLGGPRGTARNGEVVAAKNSLYIREEDMPKGVCYLCIHIYPDETAELTFTVHLPPPTPRGAAILKENGK